MIKQLTYTLIIICVFSNTIMGQQTLKGTTQKTIKSDNEMKTLFTNTNEFNIGAFGAPMIQFANIKGDLGVYIGGFIAVLLNKKIAIGAFGQGIVAQGYFNGDDLHPSTTDEQALEINGGEGGLYCEYIIKQNDPIHISFPITIGIGSIKVTDKDYSFKPNDYNNNSNQNRVIETATSYSANGGVSVEFNMTSFFVPSVYIGYRHVVLNSALANINASEMSGLCASLRFKFGEF